MMEAALAMRKGDEKMSFGLVLGGGSVRGLAHIGVLKVLKKYQIPIDFIAGTSMGGAIGGLVSAGIDIEEIEQFVLVIPSIHIAEVGYGSRSMLGGNKIYTMLLQFLEQKGLGDMRVQDTEIPFRPVAVDLNSGSEYIFDHGNLGVSLRATTAIPGMFAPVEFEGRLLVDGGLLNNLPADVAREAGMDHVLAVDVGRERHMKEPKSMFDVLQRSMDVLLADNVKRRVPYADIILKPEVGQYPAFELTKMKACIEAGEREAEANIKQIADLLEG